MSLNLGIIASSRTTASALLLDTYPGAAAAYSLRKLRTGYTGAAIRVSNSSLAEMNIGFVNNVLDTTTLLTFVGTGNGRVITWYDQSGNSNNAVTISGATQPPLIVINGVLQTQNSLPCVRFRGTTNSESLAISTPIEANTNLSIFMTAKSDNTTTQGAMLGALGAPTVFFGSYGSSSPNAAINAGLNGTYKFVTTVPDYTTSNYVIYNCVVNSTNYYIYQNNNTFTISSSNASLNPTAYSRIGQYATVASNAIFQEIILYKLDQLSNRTGIVNNTNSFYSIF